MTDQLKSTIFRLSLTANIVGVLAFAAAAATMTIATLLAFGGALPWLEFEASFGGVVYENAGQIAQIGLTVLLLLLCVYLPSAHRVLRLENSHRRFAMSMQDVAQAYAAVHEADRAGAFTMTSEYDAVRERLHHLRTHPDLGALEPDILELAAQMSRISQDLAETYSDEKVTRARTFLQQRQQEIDTFNTRLEQAKQVTAELKNWATSVELDESMAASQLNRLRDSLGEILPELSRPEEGRKGKKVVPIAKFAAE